MAQLSQTLVDAALDPYLSATIPVLSTTGVSTALGRNFGVVAGLSAELERIRELRLQKQPFIK